MYPSLIRKKRKKKIRQKEYTLLITIIVFISVLKKYNFDNVEITMLITD